MHFLIQKEVIPQNLIKIAFPKLEIGVAVRGVVFPKSEIGPAS